MPGIISPVRRPSFLGTVVIFYSLDGYIAALFQDMRDLFLFGRLYRFAFFGTVVIFFSLDSYIASLFQDMRDLFLFRRLYRFAFSGTAVIFFSLDDSVASLFKIWVTFRQKSRLLTHEVPGHKRLKRLLSEYLFFGSRAKCLYGQKKKE